MNYKCIPGRLGGGGWLAALILFFAGATLLWLHLDHSPPAWDDSWYLTNSLVLYDALADRGLPGFFEQFFSVLGFKAPLITALPAPFYLLAGRDWHSAFLVNLAAMLLLFIAVYSIGRRVASRMAGLLAVIVIATMPLLYGLARWYLVEYTLTATVAAALWLLLLTRNLEDRRWTCALGAVCGLGLLLKASFPVFIAVPLGIAFYRARRRFEALALFVAPCVVLAVPWYALHWRATLRNAIDAAYGEASTRAQGTGAIFSVDSIKDYFSLVAQDGTSIYYVALAFALMAALVWRRDDGAVRRITAACGPWVAPIVLFIFAGNKDIRYAAPLYPAFGLALGIALEALFASRKWIPCLLMITPIASMLAISFGWPYSSSDHRYARRYDASFWPQEEIAKQIAAIGYPPHGGRILIGSDRERFNVNNFELAFRQQRVPLSVESTAYESDVNALFRTADSASFFLYKDGGEPESPIFNVHYREVADHVRNSPNAEEIPLRAELAKLPDGGIARLFRIKRKVLSTVLPPLPDLHATFEDLMELQGLSIHPTAGAIELTYGWRCIRTPDREYWCFTHILDEAGKIVGQLDHRLADGNPAITEWRAGEGTAETLRFLFPHNIARQKIRLKIGLYNVPTGERLRVTLPPGSTAKVTDDGTALMIEP